MSELITHGLHEILGKDKACNTIGEILKERPLSVYWGTAPTGVIHLAYFIPLLKIRDFVIAGCDMKILIADLHAEFDALKTSQNSLLARRDFYQTALSIMLESIGVDLAAINFIMGSEYQFTEEYQRIVMKLFTSVNNRTAFKASSAVVKTTGDISTSLVSNSIYPLYQIADEYFLNVDAQLGGHDQRKIFTLAEEYAKKLKRKKVIHLMNPMMRSLKGDKMSSSSFENTKISIMDTDKQIKKKINSIFLEDGNDDSVIFDIINLVLLRLNKFLDYSNIEDLRKDYIDKKLTPQIIKQETIAHLQHLLDQLRNHPKFPILQNLYENGYLTSS